MRPPRNTSHDLSVPVQYVKGIGPRRAALLEAQNIRTVRDLLYYFPFGYIDTGSALPISGLRRYANTQQWITILGRVQSAEVAGRPPRQRLVVLLGDDTGSIPLVFFRSISFFRKAFLPGELLAVSGKVTSFMGRTQIVHPSVDRLAEGGEGEEDLQGFLHTRGLVPKYGSTEELKGVNLHVKGLRRILRTVLDSFLGSVRDPLPSTMRERLGLVDLPRALEQIHFPKTSEALDEARRRLKFDELFAMQYLLAMRRRLVKAETPGIPFRVESPLARRLADGLPFRLTRAQVKVIREVARDMESPRPMHRLIQGDVGSGKTVVALLSMLVAVENGYQAAFMAPTEILAEQHYRTLSSLLEGLPVTIRLLVGGQRTRLRVDILEDLRQGSAQIVVGTHALIQGEVSFARLGLVVIDEQHRFGVLQRLALREKGGLKAGVPVPDLLVMTATPIPRTYSMTLYGDLDVSIINELPAGRKAIRTVILLESQASRIHGLVREQVSSGRQAYVVYPLVEESEKVDLKAATESYEKLRSEVFPDVHLGLVHGRMPPEEKEAVMRAFKKGEIQVLVATTVIEVGIDVPNATLMVIEHAERFGLSQLHQLRGRVGRGAEQSTCVLVAPDWMGRFLRAPKEPLLTGDAEEEEQWQAVRRLSTMVETNDGFRIAEVDLALRGPGDLFGTRQSGLPALQLANLLTDGAILEEARAEAFRIAEDDPQLRLPDHAPLKQEVQERMKDLLALMEG